VTQWHSTSCGAASDADCTDCTVKNDFAQPAKKIGDTITLDEVAARPRGLFDNVNDSTSRFANPQLEAKKAMYQLAAGDYDVSATRAKLSTLIQTTPAVMFSLSTWPFCKSTKGLFDYLGVDYRVVELEGAAGSTELCEALAFRAELAALTGRTSVPSVWIGGQFVGGYNDGGLGGVATLYKSGRLRQLLVAANAIKG
jgi:glutaredoxin 3